MKIITINSALDLTYVEYQDELISYETFDITGLLILPMIAYWEPSPSMLLHKANRDSHSSSTKTAERLASGMSILVNNLSLFKYSFIGNWAPAMSHNQPFSSIPSSIE